MTSTSDILELERAGWKALASSGDEAAAFYGEVLADQVLMLLPEGTVLDDRALVVESMRGDPWDSFDLSDERVLSLTEQSAVVAYRARARRGDTEYAALFNSTYVRQDGEWRLAVHQQTPI